MITLENCPKDFQETFALNRNCCNCGQVQFVDKQYYQTLIKDKFYCVRYNVANKIDKIYLPQMINDSDYLVRKIVAQRINESYLFQMLADENLDVRKIAERRLKKNKECNICEKRKNK